MIVNQFHLFGANEIENSGGTRVGHRQTIALFLSCLPDSSLDLCSVSVVVANGSLVIYECGYMKVQPWSSEHG